MYLNVSIFHDRFGKKMSGAKRSNSYSTLYLHENSFLKSKL